MTKPIAAVAALILVEECRLRLDDPVDDLLPEFAGLRVLARPDGPVDETVPADRPMTLRDVLTFRLGWGGDFADFRPKPIDEAIAALELGMGPPQPALPPPPDEWMRRMGSVPLQYQPGTRWLYNTGAEVLGVLVARASGQPFDEFLAERVCAPLGMVDTGFHVPAAKLDRFGACFGFDAATGETGPGAVYDPADGQWASPPAFPSGGAGLVSTLADVHAFGEMMLAGGTRRGERLLSRSTVAAMTTNQLTGAQLAEAAPTPTAPRAGGSASASSWPAAAPPARPALTGGTAASAAPGPTTRRRGWSG